MATGDGANWVVRFVDRRTANRLMHCSSSSMLILGHTAPTGMAQPVSPRRAHAHATSEHDHAAMGFVRTNEMNEMKPAPQAAHPEASRHKVLVLCAAVHGRYCALLRGIPPWIHRHQRKPSVVGAVHNAAVLEEVAGPMRQAIDDHSGTSSEEGCAKLARALVTAWGQAEDRGGTYERTAMPKQTIANA